MGDVARVGVWGKLRKLSKDGTTQTNGMEVLLPQEEG